MPAAYLFPGSYPDSGYQYHNQNPGNTQYLGLDILQEREDIMDRIDDLMEEIMEAVDKDIKREDRIWLSLEFIDSEEEGIEVGASLVEMMKTRPTLKRVISRALAINKLSELREEASGGGGGDENSVIFLTESYWEALIRKIRAEFGD